ncbi:putative non-specific serine/threonine protein kinase [Helianthus anomalus]
MLKLSDEGSLQLFSLSNTLVWSSPSYKLAKNSNPVAQLLDIGNLVIRDDVSNNISWQSFAHPGDTWLPGMKIGVDCNWIHLHRNLTSWKTSDDPSLDDVLDSSIGYWNGLGFSGVLSLRPNNLNAFDFVVTDREIYTILVTNTFVTRMILDPQGNFVQLVWNDIKQSWQNYANTLQDICDRYSLCGPYGICRIKMPQCVHASNKCENVCASNVSCTAFANTNIRGGKSGCLTWSGELMDIGEAPQGDVSGQDIYIKLANLKVILKCICDFLESMFHVSSGYSNIL